MERLFPTLQKLTAFILVVALSLFLGACGGGGGGGGDRGQAQVAATTDADTAGTTRTGGNASAQSGRYQLTGMTGRGVAGTAATNANASTQEVGVARLGWRAPTQRVDGASLSISEIAGYRIYYGIRSGHYDSMLSVDDPYTFAVRIDDLPVGTYYFVMTAVDTNGIESGYSGEAVKTVQS
ncbi:MAG: hypothetical protein PVI91_04930 [Gammaproteobacteria bacterium]|jgi:hypothetical protein